MLLGVVAVISVIIVLTLLIAGFINGDERKETLETEIKREKIIDCLPGDNCGACGCKSCAVLAEKIASGERDATSCPSGGAAVSQAISVILGVEDKPNFPMRAQVMCSCTEYASDTKYDYDEQNGAIDCRAVMNLGGGTKSCRFACIGMGSCQKSCPYGAIDVENGLATVDYKKCTGCGICVDVCPKHLIKMIPYDAYYWVGCSSREKSRRTAKNCSLGCTGCGECEKVCPAKAISLKDNLAVINQNLCTGCGMCYKMCPQGIIWKADAVGVSDLIFTKGAKR